LPHLVRDIGGGSWYRAVDTESDGGFRNGEKPVVELQGRIRNSDALLVS
jgi:hypothetical protein